MTQRRYFKVFAACMLLAFSSSQAQTPVEVLVSNRGGNSIARFDATGTYLGDFISSGSGGLNAPQDIIFHPDGTVLVTGIGNTAIKRYDGITGVFLGNFSSGYTLSLPSKMSIGADSLIYVTQWGATQNKVVRFDLLGNFVDEFTSIGAPKGLGHTWDKYRNFYVSLFGITGGAGTVHKFDSAGNDSGTFINSVILDGPTDIWLDDNGDMLVEDWNAGKILRFDSTGNYVSTFTTGMTNPEGLAFMPNGNILVCDWGEDAVHLIDSNGNLLGYFCSTDLVDPNCVKVRPATTTQVADIGSVTKFVVPNYGRQFTITMPAHLQSGGRVRVLNTNGEMVQQFETTREASWDATDRPSGLYFIFIFAGGQMFCEKVFVD